MLAKSTEYMMQYSRKVAVAFRVAFVVCLAVLVSGLVPVVVQSYGWYDMAQKAGGIDHIVEAITEAPACEFCRAAEELQKQSQPGKENTPQQERVEIVKVYAVLQGDDHFLASVGSEFDPHAWRSAGNDVLPKSLADEPLTPPPELFV